MKQSIQQVRQEALERAVNPIGSLSNFPVIIQGFSARGIPVADIRPRENVFTYQAWRALGRQVRRGEHGIKVVTYVSTEAQQTAEDGSEQTVVKRRPWTATVFHVSQTDPIANS